MSRIFIKLIILITVLYSAIYLVDKIKFPSPNQQIEKLFQMKTLKL